MAAYSFAPGLNHRKKKRYQDCYGRNYDEQLDQCESQQALVTFSGFDSDFNILFLR